MFSQNGCERAEFLARGRLTECAVQMASCHAAPSRDDSLSWCFRPPNFPPHRKLCDIRNEHDGKPVEPPRSYATPVRSALPEGKTSRGMNSAGGGRGIGGAGGKGGVGGGGGKQAAKQEEQSGAAGKDETADWLTKGNEWLGARVGQPMHHSE
jgi:hypothetical protein